ncbi:MAG: hypothetical protein HGA37_16035 [Lentimicrobium sp.]|nr:hypothetical protein [Lentimicrobium sp.]
MKFGKIDPAQLSMKYYEADTSAGALILGDIGDISLTWDDHYGWRMQNKRHFRVKVFNSTGFDLANFKLETVEYNSLLKDQIIKLKATSYNLENGKIVETALEKSNIFTEEISSIEKSNNFSVPNIKNGCIFEVEYLLASDIYWVLPDWDFQYQFPALYSELSLSIPEYFKFKTLMKGYISPTTTESKSFTRNIIFYYSDGTSTNVPYTDLVQKFRFENVPAFRQEPYMNALNNYLAAIEFEFASENFPLKKRDYTTSWEKISKDLWDDENFGLQLKRNCPIKEEAELIKVTYTDPKERLIKAFELIRNAMAFNDRYGIYITKTLRKAWEEKKGKASDINMLLISLLKELDIEANPVILSTRSNGVLHPAQIMLGKFNYVIAEARIGEETFLLDATDKKLPYSILPRRCLNGKGRRVSQIESQNDWVSLSANKQNERLLYAVTTVSPDGNITGDFNLMETTYFAYDRAEEIKEENSNEDYAAIYEAERPGLIINEFIVENLDNREQPLYLKYKAEYNLSDESPKDMIYLSPTMGAGITSNPFIAESREFPVDFINPWSSKIINMITIPEGYQVAELPKSAIYTLPNQIGSYKYTIAANGNQIQLMCVVDIKSSQILAENYPDVREFYSLIVAKYAEMVVLKKI